MKYVHLSLLSGIETENIMKYYFSLGPDTWHKICPIATGERQSPIDLTDNIVKGGTFQPFSVYYPTLSNTKFLNNGHSVQFQPDDSDNFTGA